MDKSNKELAQKSIMFNFSSYAKEKVNKKRSKKGLGELKPRENNPYKMILTNSIAVCCAKTLLTPIDRLRFIS
jgi:hypothetical protein